MASRAIVRALPWLLLPLWLASTAWAFWWFDARLQRPFVHDTAPYVELMSSPSLPQQLLAVLDEARDGGPGVTLIHFRDPDCPCNRFNDPHLAQIIRQYRAKGVHLVTVDSGDVQTTLAEQLQRWLPVPASPAALVIDGSGELAYFGPYSAGVGCITGAGTFVERAIERALRGTATTQLNILNAGCYCAWPSTAGGWHITSGTSQS